MDIFTCRSVLFLSVYICLSVCLLVVHAWTNKRVHKELLDASLSLVSSAVESSSFTVPACKIALGTPHYHVSDVPVDAS